MTLGRRDRHRERRRTLRRERRKLSPHASSRLADNINI